MATNFLIALASALGSATLILVVLRLLLKAFAPNAFKQMIPESVLPATNQAPRLILHDDSGLSGFIPQAFPASVPINPLIIDTVTLSALTGTQVANLLRSNLLAYGTQSMFEIGADVARPEKRKEDKKKSLSAVEILSPPGQQSVLPPSSTGKKSSLGVPNEALCGSAG